MKKSISLNKTWYGLIVLTIVLPMMILLVWIGYMAHSLLLKNAILNERQYNQEIKTNINKEFNRIVTLLRNKSDPMAFTLSRTLNEDLLKELFEAVFSRESLINSLSLVSSESQMILGLDRYGKTLNSIEDNKKFPGYENNHVDYGHLFNSKPPEIVIPLHGRTYVSSPFYKEGKSSFYIGVPVGPLSQPVAALVAFVNTAGLWKNIQSEISRSGVNSHLVDSHGSLLVASSDLDLHAGKLITYLEIVRAVISNRDWDSIEPYAGINEEHVFGVASYLDTLNWGVLSEIPSKNITDPIYKVLFALAGVIFTVVFLFGGMGLFFVNRLLKPFNSLSNVFDRVAVGDYATKITSSHVKEIDTIVTGFNNMTREINQREGELRNSEERLHAILDNATAVIYLKDIQGRYLLINHHYEKLFHINEKEIIGKTDYDIFPKAVADVFVMNDRKVIEDRAPIEFEEVVPHDDGPHTYISIKFPLFDLQGTIYGVCGISTDITDRKLINETLLKSESRLSEAQRIAHIGNWEWDIINNKIIWSDEIYRIFGFKPQEFTATYELFLNSVHFDDREFVKGIVDKVLQEGKAYNIKHRIILPNGTVRFVKERAEVTFNDKGKPVRMLGTVQDITEARKAQEELLKMQKLESVGILAGGVAHDFNNYLQGIMGVITLAGVHISPDDEIHTKLEEAKQIIRQSRSLTQQLLTFSKGGEPVKSNIFISEFLKDIVSISLSGSNIRCKFSIPDALLPVEADKGQLGQVFNNIIINANQSMPEGGIIKIWAENFPVIKEDTLHLKEGMYVKIAVEDQGTGIPQKDLTKIFDPYFTTKQKGSGLGLATVYSIIKKHNGVITLESKMGVGTTFYIYLPAPQKETFQEPVQSKAATKSTEEEPVTRKGKILLMDDEASIRLNTTMNLRNLKYEVEEARDGEEAIKLYKSAMESNEAFDVVVLDLTIVDGIGGEKTIKKLLEIDPDVKAVVASGYVNNRIMTNFKKYGFREILAKPYEIEELDVVLQKVMKEKQT